MLSEFKRAAAVASKSVDAVYGEAFIFKPMKRADDVNARLLSDSDRDEVTILAVVAQSFARALEGAARVQGVKSEMPGHSTVRPVISVDRDKLGDIRVGDRFQRVSDAALFQVAEIRRHDPARILLDVNRI